ncbi:Uma2 family endonuclease [Streptomyces chitinivorans]|uniref:Uma2 family endonuclease n=1 Tax=Streptomyces chitinivorans TaxID=1257027 RepID=A0ABW7HTL3_9ACTN|nr:Uma2 family endonuclease [Streptomyces chitinivorans]MDH2410751.1 Uma2 family endonuclease [Streptomyces chitinivorans]
MTVMLERPTAIDVPSGTARFRALCRTLLDMEVPDGYRAEIIGGNIVMSPWSQKFYMPVMRSLRSQLEPHAPSGHIVDVAPFLFTFPGAERAYGPDVYAVAEKAFDGHGRYVDGEALSLVAELTSDSTRETDRTDKVSAYGRSGVPVYLLLDMEEQAATVFWRPSERGYDSRLTTPFGEPLRIPEPFGCDLDTSGFKTPAGEPDGAEGR